MQEKAVSIYNEVKQKSGDNNILVLHIMNEQTLLIFGADKNDIKVLPYGSNSLSSTYFKHCPPTEAEIEMAIMKVEDEIMPLVTDIQKLNLQLVSFDEKLHETSNYISYHDNLIYTADIEGIFTRLAAIITGRPSSMDILPTENNFAAYILILREIMHHLRFNSVRML